MILNAGNDRLLWKVFLARLKGPPWLGSTNFHGDLSTRSASCGLHLFPSTYAQFDRREILVLCKPVRPEKFQFLEKGQNRNFDYKKCNFG